MSGQARKLVEEARERFKPQGCWDVDEYGESYQDGTVQPLMRSETYTALLDALEAALDREERLRDVISAALYAIEHGMERESGFLFQNQGKLIKHVEETLG